MFEGCQGPFKVADALAQPEPEPEPACPSATGLRTFQWMTRTARRFTWGTAALASAYGRTASLRLPIVRGGLGRARAPLGSPAGFGIGGAPLWVVAARAWSARIGHAGCDGERPAPGGLARR